MASAHVWASPVGTTGRGTFRGTWSPRHPHNSPHAAPRQRRRARRSPGRWREERLVARARDVLPPRGHVRQRRSRPAIAFCTSSECMSFMSLMYCSASASRPGVSIPEVSPNFCRYWWVAVLCERVRSPSMMIGGARLVDSAPKSAAKPRSGGGRAAERPRRASGRGRGRARGWDADDDRRRHGDAVELWAAAVLDFGRAG